MEVRFEGFDELNKYIKKLIVLVKSPASFYKDAKLIIFRDVMNHFQKEEGPDGAWTPLKLYTIRGNKVVSLRLRHGKIGKAKILQDKGILKGSITGISDNKHTEVGTNTIYGRTHQQGRGAIPARPFIWLSEQASMQMLDRLLFYVGEPS